MRILPPGSVLTWDTHKFISAIIVISTTKIRSGITHNRVYPSEYKGWNVVMETSPNHWTEDQIYQDASGLVCVRRLSIEEVLTHSESGVRKLVHHRWYRKQLQASSVK